jgi:Tol biopolymer transport system component
MFPSVSTGPMDPAWSPDGRWIAFSMRGDIWKVPAEGGTAIALTSGPGVYHFEPAWSPDGTRIALPTSVASLNCLYMTFRVHISVQTITRHLH